MTRHQKLNSCRVMNNPGGNSVHTAEPSCHLSIENKYLHAFVKNQLATAKKSQYRTLIFDLMRNLYIYNACIYIYSI